MSTIYTHEVFKKFQTEVFEAVVCFSLTEKENCMTKVQDFEKNVKFMIS